MFILKRSDRLYIKGLAKRRISLMNVQADWQTITNALVIILVFSMFMNLVLMTFYLFHKVDRSPNQYCL